MQDKKIMNFTAECQKYAVECDFNAECDTSVWNAALYEK